MTEDRSFMQLALDLAKEAQGRTSPNPMVGALVVRDGQIVGRGFHKKAGSEHAEVVALREAGEKARGATLYVTLEPCCHYGRTPPCTKAILRAGIARVVVAMADPNPLVAGKGIQELRAAGVEVTAGVLGEAAASLNEVFIKYITTGRPFVSLKMALTLDGKIATTQGDSFWVSGPAARRWVHQLRDRVDAVMVGVNTLLRDDPLLTTRLEGLKGHDPVRVIVDSRGRTPPTARVLRGESSSPAIIATTPAASAEKLEELRRAGAEVLMCREKSGQVDLPDLFFALGRREITSLLLEGGPRLNASALREGLVDKIHFFLAPKVVGGLAAPGPIGDLGIERMPGALAIQDLTCERVGEDFLLTGYLRGGER
ncbi:MAG: bifunctional diaminohydroxyphosphoribosylaminopyrimidine deaminase/5-amino-6-(5-phosphoribosylamino)uracil reductase RibD [Firmicutes bacterium]|nr:bifunctional diaminohydroxyphosphoribosylaminopyrimidine deaminase/5-amino-6-(5-phosphoribosylamino)uracil reductase RibD [Bacillota bacterium]